MEEELLEDHQRKVNMVLDWLEEHDLYLRPLKCFFKQEQTAFLGIVVSHQMVAIDPRKLQTIAGWDGNLQRMSEEFKDFWALQDSTDTL